MKCKPDDEDLDLVNFLVYCAGLKKEEEKNENEIYITYINYSPGSIVSLLFFSDSLIGSDILSEKQSKSIQTFSLYSNNNFF